MRDELATIAMNFSDQPETATKWRRYWVCRESQMHADPGVSMRDQRKAGETTRFSSAGWQDERPVGYAIYKLLSLDPPDNAHVIRARVQQRSGISCAMVRPQLLKAAYLEMVRSAGGELPREQSSRTDRAKTQASGRS